MASLTRVLQNLFGVSHGTNEIAQFGSLAAGSPMYTDDPSLIQALNQFAEGLFSATASASQAPRIEDFNGLFLLLFRQLKYLFQSGVAEWTAAENYYSGKSVAMRSGILYKALTGSDVAPNINIDPATDNGTNWAKLWDATNDGSGSGLDADLLDGQQGSFYRAVGNITGLGSGVSTLLAAPIGDNGNVASTTYTMSPGQYYAFLSGAASISGILEVSFAWAGLTSVSLTLAVSYPNSANPPTVSVLSCSTGNTFNIICGIDGSNNLWVALQCPSGATGMQTPKARWVATTGNSSALLAPSAANVYTTFPGTSNQKIIVSNPGPAPAPMSGQTHSFGTIDGVTLDPCNLYETRYASANFPSGTLYGVFLPSGGTYQWLNFAYTTALNMATGENAGGTQIGSNASQAASFSIIYRRIA